jgi:hypothetical protein
MKLAIATIVLACALGACKGKSASTTPQDAPPSPCSRTATHATKIMQNEIGPALSEADWPKVTALLAERCEADAWAAEVVACMDASLGEDDFEKCADQLTKEQNDAVKEQFGREIEPLMKEEGGLRKKDAAPDGMEGGSGAPSTGAPPPPDDPCGGGE